LCPPLCVGFTRSHAPEGSALPGRALGAGCCPLDGRGLQSAPLPLWPSRQHGCDSNHKKAEIHAPEPCIRRSARELETVSWSWSARVDLLGRDPCSGRRSLRPRVRGGSTAARGAATAMGGHEPMWRSLLFAMSVVLGLGSSTGGAAAQAPQLHYGGDTRPIGPSECIRRAKANVQARGWPYSITGTSTVVGAARTLTSVGPNVVVMVRCVILGLGTNTRVNILVAAASPSGKVAERIRNEVRIAVMR
jgi:hypothetical protein